MDLDFLLRSAQNCQKCIFLDYLRTLIQEGNITREMTPFLSSSFLALTVCNIHFWIWKYPTFIFIWSPLGPFQSLKYLNIWPKATDSETHHTLLKSRHPEAILCFVHSPEPNTHFLWPSSWTICRIWQMSYNVSEMGNIIGYRRSTLTLKWTFRKSNTIKIHSVVLKSKFSLKLYDKPPWKFV